jgi:hypothetical protein
MKNKILDLIKKDEIRVIGKRTDAKVGIKSSELKPFVMQHKQEIIDIYFDEKEREEKEREERYKRDKIEKMKKKYSSPDAIIAIKKRFGEELKLDEELLEVLEIENIDFEGLKKYAKDYDENFTYYELTVAELKELATEREEVEEIEKTEEEKEIERLAEIAKETGKPQVLKENTSWNPDKGIPVIDYTLVNAEGKTYLYTKELE